MIRVVIDTNVLVSSLLTPGGIPDKLIEVWSSGRFLLCMSQETFREVAYVLERPKVRRRAGVSAERVRTFLEALLDGALMVEGQPRLDIPCAAIQTMTSCSRWRWSSGPTPW